jgi:diaminopimelate epimerase
MSGDIPLIPFHKLHGCGNDFVFIDNRELRLPVARMPDWTRAVCRRALGVGADGLVFLESSAPGSGADYVWHFYNADGSRAEMCGNASRCSALLATELGLAAPEHVIGTDAGLIRARADTENSSARVELTRPRDLALNLALEVDRIPFVVHFVNTGVPHAVIQVDDIAKADVRTIGAALRRHSRFAPAGANVDFLFVRDRRHLTVRTYERGVEDETRACGTGAAAAAFIAHALRLSEAKVDVETSGGEVLGVDIEEEAIFLSGKAVHTFSGQLRPAGLGLSLV